MDDMNAFERQVAGEFVRRAGPVRPVDAAAILTAITATQSPKWRFGSMFSAAKFVVAGAVVALFGGFLLAGLLTQPGEDTVPAVGASASPVPDASEAAASTAEATIAPDSTSTPGLTAGTFSAAGTLNEPRAGHSATLLPDGRVLVVGGGRAGFEPAEVWDPATETSSPAGSLADARDGRTATLLPDGRVLLVGGRGLYGPSPSIAEVWDPATASFGPAGSLVETREEHTATLLPDGRVLVIGGRGTDGDLASAEYWDPATETSTAAGSLATARWGHTATLLPDGRVLIIGGWSSGTDHDIAAAEVWDPATESFTPAGSLAEPRALHSAMLLPAGRVLVVAGQDADDLVRTLAEVWDPATESFTPAGSLAEPRRDPAVSLLPGGRVLVVGGSGDGLTPLTSTEVWDPSTTTFGPAASLAEARSGHTATRLPDGRVLALGGVRGDGPIASVEAWSPVAAEPEARDDTSAPDLLPGVDLVTEEVEPGVYRVLSDGVRDLDRELDWRDSDVLQIIPGLDGSVLLTTGDMFFRLGSPEIFVDRDPRIVEFMGDTQVSRFLPFGVAPTGTLWGRAGAPDDLATWDGERWVVIEEPAYMNLVPDGWGDDPYPGDSIRAVLAADGNVWVVAEPGVPGPGSLFRVNEDGFEPMGVVEGITADATGELILVAHDDGMVRATTNGLEPYSDTHSLDGSEPVGVASDGTLWWTTTVDGCAVSLARLDARGWSTFDIPDGVVSREERGARGCGVTVAPDGSVWVGHGAFDMPGAGVHRFDGSTWTQYLPDLTVHDLESAPDGSVWLWARTHFPGQEPDSPEVPGGLYVITPEAVAGTE